jgi:diguanylate cyclase (GGDEF)-like protein
LARAERRKWTDRRVNGRRPSESGDAEHYSRSFRLGFGAVVFAVVSLNLAVGVAVWVGEHRIAQYTSSIYDDAFAAAAHIQKSELSFEKFVAARAAPAHHWGDEAADDLLATSADELEVAIEHTQAEPTRALEQAIRADIDSLRGQSSDDPSVPARLAEAEAGLGQLASADDSTARREIQEFSSKGDRLLLALAAARVLVAAVFLIILFRMMRRMSRLANYDPLTGLLKPPLLRARLRQAVLRLRNDSCGFALLSLDLDRFKRVNDTLGHQTGDLLLREVAARISSEVQPGDVVARFGGDEFVILQASLRAAKDAGELAGRLVAALGAPYEIDGQRILIGASVGIALAPENGKDAEALMRNSDIALYQAKAGGKGRFLYFAVEMDKRVLEMELLETLAKKQSEIYSQPLADISTGRIVAC